MRNRKGDLEGGIRWKGEGGGGGGGVQQREGDANAIENILSRMSQGSTELKSEGKGLRHAQFLLR